MEHTRELLLRGDLSLQDIAEAVGFSDESYLRRQFLRYYGFTPTEFLRIERGLTLDRPIRSGVKPHNKKTTE
jgi:AraC-like DNA-binding protein